MTNPTAQSVTTPAVKTLTPRLVATDADAAIDVYRRALGARLVERFTGEQGAVVHAEMAIGESRIALKDEDGADRSATTLGGSAVILQIDVADADATAAALLAEGGRVVFEVGDTTYGFRQGRIEDPFGFQWLISQQIEDLSADEVQRRLGPGSEGAAS